MMYYSAVQGSIKSMYSHRHGKYMAVSTGICYVLVHIIFRLWKRRQLSQKRQKRQDQAKARIRNTREKCSHVATADSIPAMPVTELLKALKSGQLSAVEVLQAFQKKALAVTSEINCITETVDEAMALAQALDASADKSALLHGLPVSIKENTGLAGYDSTAGMSAKIGLTHEKDSVIVQVLKRQGAIPFVRTNIPQTMLSYGCSNPLYGKTLNPQDKTRVPGGSSGGEGALIGAGGSMVGIGSDIGGSVRIPSEFCGIYGLKTTSGRLSYKGLFTTIQGNVTIKAVIGPMARNLESLVLLSRAMMSKDMYELDRKLPRLPFDEQEFNQTGPLRIGYYTFDGMFQCQPPVVRAVMEAKAALERMGHQVVPFSYPPTMGIWSGENIIRILSADRALDIQKSLAYDIVDPVVANSIFLLGLPTMALKALKFLLSVVDPVMSRLVMSFGGYTSIHDFFDHVAGYLDWVERFTDAWTEQELDAVICPVFPSPAVTSEVVGDVTACGTYTQLYNALNYPGGVMPVTHVTKEDVDATCNPELFKPANRLEKLLLQSTKTSKGIKVGVQCVALPFMEERCLRVMRDIEKGLQHH